MSTDLRTIDLNLLVSLQALLTDRNVTVAARRMSVSQSAMSGSLGRLRKLFDDPLLVRNGRELVLTTRAEALIDPVDEILRQVGEVLMAPEPFDPETSTRTFWITASDYATAVLIAPMIRSLHDEAPNVRVNIRPRSDVPRLIREDVVDLAVEPVEIMEETALPSSELFSDQWVCIVDAEINAAVVDRGLELDDYQRLPHLVYFFLNKEMQLNLADLYMDAQGVERRIECAVESFLLVPQLVRGTRMVSLALERSTRLQPMDGLALVDPPLPVPDVNLAMFWNPRHTDDPGHRWLRGRITSAANELAAPRAMRHG